MNGLRRVYNWIFAKVKILFACDIKTELPESTVITHPVGIVIGKNVELGENILIRQNVTLGRRGIRHNSDHQPKLHDNVRLGAGAVILGNVTVGKNAIVGANSVVLEDVPPNAMVVGAPAKIVEHSD
jgi:serine O-acetyltransferase